MCIENNNKEDVGEGFFCTNSVRLICYNKYKQI